MLNKTIGALNDENETNRPKLDLKERQEIWLNPCKAECCEMDSAESQRSKVNLNDTEESKHGRS